MQGKGVGKYYYALLVLVPVLICILRSVIFYSVICIQRRNCCKWKERWTLCSKLRFCVHYGDCSSWNNVHRYKKLDLVDFCLVCFLIPTVLPSHSLLEQYHIKQWNFYGNFFRGDENSSVLAIFSLHLILTFIAVLCSACYMVQVPLSRISAK